MVSLQMKVELIELSELNVQSMFHRPKPVTSVSCCFSIRYNEISEDVFEMLEECGRINY